MNKSLSIALIVLLYSNQGLWAQSSTDDIGFGFYFFGGINVSNYEDLNTLIDQTGYSEFDNLSPSAGIGIIFSLSERLTMITEIRSANQDHKNEFDQSSKLKLTRSTLSFGYRLIAEKSVEFYPILGFGYSSINISLQDSVPVNTPFNTFISSSDQSVGMKNSSFTFRVGEQLLITPFADIKSFFIGFDLGYDYAFTQNEWTSNEVDLSDGPGVNAGGIYLNISVGFRTWGSNYQD